jgi:hypothetical protein
MIKRLRSYVYINGHAWELNCSTKKYLGLGGIFGIAGFESLRVVVE